MCELADRMLDLSGCWADFKDASEAGQLDQAAGHAIALAMMCRAFSGFVAQAPVRSRRRCVETTILGVSLAVPASVE